MTQFAIPLQEAVYTLLTNSALSANVFDDVPDLPAGMPHDSFPYIVLGDDTFLPDDADDILGTDATIYLHIWSRYEGSKEVKEIMSEIDVVLNRQEPSLIASGFKFVNCLLEYSSISTNNDGETRHGIIRYRVTIHKE